MIRKLTFVFAFVGATTFAFTSCGGGEQEAAPTTDSHEATDETTSTEESVGEALGGLFGSVMKQAVDSMQSGVDQMVEGMGMMADSINAAMDTASVKMGEEVDDFNDAMNGK